MHRITPEKFGKAEKKVLSLALFLLGASIDFTKTGAHMKQLAISVLGTALSAFALKRGESKVWNILIIVFLVLYTAVIFWRTVVFWQGAMGV